MTSGGFLDLGVGKGPAHLPDPVRHGLFRQSPLRQVPLEFVEGSGGLEGAVGAGLGEAGQCVARVGAVERAGAGNAGKVAVAGRSPGPGYWPGGRLVQGPPPGRRVPSAGVTRAVRGASSPGRPGGPAAGSGGACPALSGMTVTPCPWAMAVATRGWRALPGRCAPGCGWRARACALPWAGPLPGLQRPGVRAIPPRVAGRHHGLPLLAPDALTGLGRLGPAATG